MISSETIYKRDSAGKLRVWSYDVDGDKWRTNAGVQGGKITTAKWTVCKPKSQPTAEEQAAFEAKAAMDQKLDREYRRTIEELDSVPSAPMLAKSYDDEKERVDAELAKEGGYVISQPKLDGIRSKTNKPVGAVSREYQKFTTVDHVLEALAPAFAAYPGIEFDGELYNHDLKADFGKIASNVRREDCTEEERAECRRLIQYHVYDLSSSPDMPFLERQALLTKALAMVDSSIVKIVETSIVNHQAGLDILLDKYIQDGYEGQMVRFNAPYEPDKRSNFLLKRKKSITEEFPFIRAEEGLGNWSGCAKRIVFKMPTPVDGSDECGAGLLGDMKFAAKLLKESPTWSDKAMVTVRHFGLMPTGGYRFPVAIDFHPNGRVD